MNTTDGFKGDVPCATWFNGPGVVDPCKCPPRNDERGNWLCCCGATLAEAMRGECICRAPEHVKEARRRRKR